MSDLSQKLLGLFSTSKLTHYKKGDILLRPGDEIDSVFYIVKGFFRVYTITESGDLRIAIYDKPGDISPFVPTLGGYKSKYFYETLTETDAFRLSREKFIDYLKNNSDVLFELIGKLTAITRYMSDRIDALEYGNVPSGLAHYLLILAHRFGEKMGSAMLIQVPLTHEEIASSMGMSRETVSREMKKLEKRQIIGYENRLIVIKDMQKLEELI